MQLQSTRVCQHYQLIFIPGAGTEVFWGSESTSRYSSGDWCHFKYGSGWCPVLTDIEGEFHRTPWTCQVLIRHYLLRYQLKIIFYKLLPLIKIWWTKKKVRGLSNILNEYSSSKTPRNQYILMHWPLFETQKSSFGKYMGVYHWRINWDFHRKNLRRDTHLIEFLSGF